MVSFSNWDVCPQTYGWFQGSLLTNIMTVLRTSIPMPMLMIAFSEHCKFIVIKIYDKYLAFKFQLPPLTAPLPLPKCEVCDTAKLCPAWSLLGWVCSPAVRHPAYLRIYGAAYLHIYISTYLHYPPHENHGALKIIVKTSPDSGAGTRHTQHQQRRDTLILNVKYLV